jgi:hypothetical protein
MVILVSCSRHNTWSSLAPQQRLARTTAPVWLELEAVSARQDLFRKAEVFMGLILH